MVARDPAGYPTLPGGRDEYYANVKIKYLTGIVTSDGTWSVGTANSSIVTYGGGEGISNPGKLPVDRTWKIRDDEGNDWFIPLFKYG